VKSENQGRDIIRALISASGSPWTRGGGAKTAVQCHDGMGRGEKRGNMEGRSAPRRSSDSCRKGRAVPRPNGMAAARVRAREKREATELMQLSGRQVKG